MDPITNKETYEAETSDELKHELFVYQKKLLGFLLKHFESEEGRCLLRICTVMCALPDPLYRDIAKVLNENCKNGSEVWKAFRETFSDQVIQEIDDALKIAPDEEEFYDIFIRLWEATLDAGIRLWDGRDVDFFKGLIREKRRHAKAKEHLEYFRKQYASEQTNN